MSPFARKRPDARLATYSLRLYPEARAALVREAARRGVPWTDLLREIAEGAARRIEASERDGALTNPGTAPR